MLDKLLELTGESIDEPLRCICYYDMVDDGFRGTVKHRIEKASDDTKTDALQIALFKSGRLRVDEVSFNTKNAHRVVAELCRARLVDEPQAPVLMSRFSDFGVFAEAIRKAGKEVPGVDEVMSVGGVVPYAVRNGINEASSVGYCFGLTRRSNNLQRYGGFEVVLSQDTYSAVTSSDGFKFAMFDCFRIRHEGDNPDRSIQALVYLIYGGRLQPEEIIVL